MSDYFQHRLGRAVACSDTGCQEASGGEGEADRDIPRDRGQPGPDSRPDRDGCTSLRPLHTLSGTIVDTGTQEPLQDIILSCK